MKYRPLGATELEVSEIAFGTGDNAGLMVLGDERTRTAAVAHALELGITYFDTAPDYGLGRAETNLGAAFAALGVRPLVATKVDYLPEDLDDLEGKVGRSIDESLQRLRLDYVDVLMVHNQPEPRRDPSRRKWTPLTPGDLLGPVLAGLEKARAQGKARYFGVSCEHADPASAAIVIESGHYHAINVRYSLVNPSAGMTMPERLRRSAGFEDLGLLAERAAQHGVGVAAIRPLAGGALARAVIERGADGRHPLASGILSQTPELFRPEIERGRAFAFLETPARTLPQAAFVFGLMHPAVSTILGGFSSLEHLTELAATSGAPPLGADDLARIREVYEHDFWMSDPVA